MKRQTEQIGTELVFLLRQQRNLYHQLKTLTDWQRRLTGSTSPELLLRIITTRRKLIGKLHDLDSKLRPIKANWEKISSQIGLEHKNQARQMAGEVQQLVGQIVAVAPAEVVEKLPLSDSGQLDGLFAQQQNKL